MFIKMEGTNISVYAFKKNWTCSLGLAHIQIQKEQTIWKTIRFQKSFCFKLLYFYIFLKLCIIIQIEAIYILVIKDNKGFFLTVLESLTPPRKLDRSDFKSEFWKIHVKISNLHCFQLNHALPDQSVSCEGKEAVDMREWRFSCDENRKLLQAKWQPQLESSHTENFIRTGQVFLIRRRTMNSTKNFPLLPTSFVKSLGKHCSK